MESAASSASSLVFLEAPKTLKINEQKTTQAHSIEALIAKLQESGALMALGQSGSNYYGSDPYLMSEKVNGRDIYAWKPGTKREECAPDTCIMVLGAQKTARAAFVYIASVDKVGPHNGQGSVHEYEPRDDRVYATSFQSFQNRLTALFTPLAEKDLSLEESTLKSLIDLPLSSLWTQQGREECILMGARIYDLFGDEGVERVLEALEKRAIDGFLRKPEIAKAWNPVGRGSW